MATPTPAFADDASADDDEGEADRTGNAGPAVKADADALGSPTIAAVGAAANAARLPVDGCA